MKFLLFLTFFWAQSMVKAVNMTWPTCYEIGVDYSGDNVIKGLRFSEGDCANWCSTVGARCVRWVYQQYATTCHLKAFEGQPRNDSDPLTSADKIAFASELATVTKVTSSSTTTISSTSTSASSSTSTPSGRKKRQAVTAASNTTLRVGGLTLSQMITKRTTELDQTYTGLLACVPPPKVYFPNCTISSMGSSAVTLSSKQSINYDMDDCSLMCALNSACTHWVFDYSNYTCYLKSGLIVKIPSGGSFFLGSKTCLGRVLEPPKSPNDNPLDGSWSPWSTIMTPCFSMDSGGLVNCGGGVQLRYRSCSEPLPRFHGRICWGSDTDYQPCNTNDCRLPEKFLWSEWGDPPVCTIGNKTRDAMCGGLRRRIPNLKGRSDGDPPVTWPSCLKYVANIAPNETLKSQKIVSSIDLCFSECKAIDPANCSYWTYNLTSKLCQFYTILIASPNNSTDVISGEKYCAGKLYFPYCAQVNLTYNASAMQAADIDNNKGVMSIENCTRTCYVQTSCNYWLYIEPDNTCFFINEITVPLTATLNFSQPGKTSYFAHYQCTTSIDLPALPEDAEELSYIEICTGDLFEEEYNYTNTWNRTTCPSPCDNNGNCTRYAECIDLSTDFAPNYTCECQMAKAMVGGRCIDPPITTPTPSPIPTMAPATRAAAMAVSSTSCFILIVLVAITLVIFIVFRIIDKGRFIHMNLEIALLCAHICLIFDPSDEVTCRNVSICIHFFFTVVFAFFTLEGVYTFSILAHIVRKDGMLSYTGNFVAGWGIGILVIAYSISFEYENYGGEYSCWLDLGTSLTFAQYTPFVLLTIMTIMLIEAGGSIDPNTMKALPNEDEGQRKSAKFMQQSLILRLGVVFVSFVLGSLARYEQSLALYFVFTVLNGILGGMIFFFHCTCNEKIRAFLSALWAKVVGKKVESSDTEKIIPNEETPEEPAQLDPEEPAQLDPEEPAQLDPEEPQDKPVDATPEEPVEAPPTEQVEVPSDEPVELHVPGEV